MTRTDPISFSCGGHTLFGLLTVPDNAVGRGVIVLVGGPQYRVGSHRQFVLLGRYLSDAGYPVLRFDHRGIGDSGGDPVSFEELAPDISSAIDEMQAQLPDIDEVVIWGLCDAASAALMYAPHDPRVRGLVLLNPWVRSDGSLARAYLGGYYITQLFSRVFWKRLFTGRVSVRQSARSLVSNIRDSVLQTSAIDGAADQVFGSNTAQPYQNRMKESLGRYDGQVLVILSGDDITATEFRKMVAGNRTWRRSLRRESVREHTISEANHTFSRSEWRDRVAEWTLEWLHSW